MRLSKAMQYMIKNECVMDVDDGIGYLQDMVTNLDNSFENEGAIYAALILLLEELKVRREEHE